MTYQPLNHRTHFSQTSQVFELLLKYSDSRFSEEDLLLAADELIHIGNGKISAEKVKEYAQRSNFFSHETVSLSSDMSWKCVPSYYDYDEESFPSVGLAAQEKLNNLVMNGGNREIC